MVIYITFIQKKFHPDPRLGLLNYEFISKQTVKVEKIEKIEDLYKTLKKKNINMVTFETNMKLLLDYIKKSK